MTSRTRAALAAAGLAVAATATVLALPDSDAARSLSPREIKQAYAEDVAKCKNPPSLVRVEERDKVRDAAVSAFQDARAAHVAAVAVAQQAVSAVAPARSRVDSARSTLAAADGRVADAHAVVNQRSRALQDAVSKRRPKSVIQARRAALRSANASLASAQVARDSALAAHASAVGALEAAKSYAEGARQSRENAAKARQVAERQRDRARDRVAKAIDTHRSRPVALTTQNIDFATGRRKDRPAVAYLCAKGSDFILLQEARNVDLAKMIWDGTRTNQNTADPGRAGSAIVWRTPTPFDGRGRSGPVSGKGLRVGVDAGKFGVHMHDRYISFIDTTIDGKRTRIIVGHWAPGRYRQTWGAMNANVKAVIRDRPRGSEWIVGGDFNQRPGAIGQVLGGHAVGASIDGFVVSDGLKVADMKVSKYAASVGATKHPSVRIEVEARR